MAGEIVQSRYEQLEEIARRFERAADEHERLHSQLLRQVGPLRSGSWIGRGVVAFLHEMDDEVLPSHLRLIFAQEEAGRVTREIAGVLQEAEERAAALFQGEGVDEIASDAAGNAVDAGRAGYELHEASAGEKVTMKNVLQYYTATIEPTAPDVRILASVGENGQTEYVVLCKGTDPAAFWTSSTSRTWLNSVATGIGLRSSYSGEIMRIIDEANLPPGAVIHLAGYSQGGHAIQSVAGDLARSGEYQVKSVTGFSTYEVRNPVPGANTIYYTNLTDPLFFVDVGKDAVINTFPAVGVLNSLKKLFSGPGREYVIWETLGHNLSGSTFMAGESTPFTSQQFTVVHQGNALEQDWAHDVRDAVVASTQDKIDQL